MNVVVDGKRVEKEFVMPFYGIYLYNCVYNYWLSYQVGLQKHRLFADQKKKLYRLHKGNESAKMSSDFINWYIMKNPRDKEEKKG